MAMALNSKQQRFAAKWPEDRRFYVYTLVDPRDGSVFYIGKGTGKRSETHAILAKRGSHYNQRVGAKIRLITLSGNLPLVARIADRLTESEAIVRERQEMSGREGLCNIAPGHRSHDEQYRERVKAAIRMFPSIRNITNPQHKRLLLDCLKAAALEFAFPTPAGLMPPGCWPPPRLLGHL